MTVFDAIGNFFMKEILGMGWLSRLMSSLLTALGVDVSTRFGGALHFFLYDTIKILLLLSVLIFGISYIQSYFPPERTKKLLGKFKGIKANIIAALLGTVTPFCSCSSIPIFIGFTSAGLPLGVTFSFLISSPLVDLGALILLTSIFGGKIAAIYVVSGLVLAVLGGTLIERLNLQNELESFLPEDGVDFISEELKSETKLHYSLSRTLWTIRKVILYVLIGVGIGSVIHNYIPQELIEKILGTQNPFSVFLATAVGIPMYADIFGVIPIAEALYLKGVGLGTVLSFMMAVTALSLPSMILLRRAVKPKLLFVFIAIVSVGILVIGYLFNAFSFLWI